MGLQLKHIFASVRSGRREKHGQALVQDLTLGIQKGAVTRSPGLQRTAAKRMGQALQAMARHPHNAHGTAAWRRCNGHYRVQRA